MSDAAPRRSVMRGIWRVARFRPEGFAEFTATRQGFLNSLAPLIAFPLVGGILVLLHAGASAMVLTDLLATLAALLAPAVISEALAERWGRSAAWLRYASAFNWAQWAVPMVAIGLLFSIGMLRGLGMSDRGAAMLVLFGIAGYGMALHWFLARHGLGVSRGKAVLAVIVMNLGTVAAAIGPRLVAAALS